MSDFNTGSPGATASPPAAEMDPGLRSFMQGVYLRLMGGLVLAGVLGWTVGNVRPVTELLFRFLGSQPIGYTPLGWAVAFGPIFIILFSNFFLTRMSVRGSGILYWLVVSVVGASLGVLFLVYAQAQIATAFFVTAAAFGGLSLAGYTTKRDLSGFRAFLIMGAWGVVIASVVSVFMSGLYTNPLFFFAFNIIGVIVFGGLIVVRTQALKMTYYALRDDGASLGVAANYGALSLFISFVNIFRFVLALMGGGGGRRS
jgi:FtsH-binding integral membrane protein